MICHSLTFARSPRDLANVNEWKSYLIPIMKSDIEITGDIRDIKDLQMESSFAQWTRLCKLLLL